MEIAPACGKQAGARATRRLLWCIHHGSSRRVDPVARKASPWFWEERGEYYVTIRGQRHRLSADKNEADRKFHELMAKPEALPRPKCPSSNGPTVAEILDKYLDWCKKHRAARTFEWYSDHLQSFLNSLPNPAELTVADLKPFHVVEWVDAHPDWSATYRRGAIVAVQRPANWAYDLGYIASNPIRKIAKPEPQRRDNHMTPEQFARVLARVKEGDPFRDLLLFVWHSGCRPQEARHIEPRHVHLAGECVLIPKEEAKGKRQPRVIMLHGPALEIIKRLMAERKEGKLFLNCNGQPWKKFALCNRFDRLTIAFGIEQLKQQGISVPALPRFNRRAYTDKAQLAAARKEQQKKLRDRRKHIVRLARQHGKGHSCYDLRHGFCQRLLESGANHLAVAELLGHANGNQVSRTYSHMNRATAHLKETLKKAAASAGA
jgi:integrase